MKQEKKLNCLLEIENELREKEEKLFLTTYERFREKRDKEFDPFSQDLES